MKSLIVSAALALLSFAPAAQAVPFKPLTQREVRHAAHVAEPTAKLGRCRVGRKHAFCGYDEYVNVYPLGEGLWTGVMLFDAHRKRILVTDLAFTTHVWVTR